MIHHPAIEKTLAMIEVAHQKHEPSIAKKLDSEDGACKYSIRVCMSRKNGAFAITVKLSEPVKADTVELSAECDDPRQERLKV